VIQNIPLGELFSISSGGTPSRKEPSYNEDGNIAWIKTGDLHVKRIFEASEYITQEGLDNSSAKLFPAGTVLVAMYGATIGACSILEIEAATNQACAAFLPNSEVDTLYLYYFLKSKKNDFVRDGVGGAQPNISATYLKMVEIPLPPLETQKQIAAVLEKADQLRKDCKLLEQELNSLAQSVFIEIFGDLRVKGRYTKKVLFSEIFNISSKLVDPKLEQYEDMPHIGPEHIEKITGKILPYKTAKEDGLISGKFHFKQGCVLFSKIRPNLKKVAIPNFDGLCSADMYPLEPVDGVSTKEFIWGLILSLTFDEYLQVLASRANIPKINRKELSLFEFYLPSFSDQKQYSSQLIQIQQQIDINRELMKEVSNNFNALMQKAFSGELNLVNAKT